LSKVAGFNLPCMHLTHLLGWPRVPVRISHRPLTTEN